MSWKDNLQPAKFKGTPFRVLDTSTLLGRRNVIHEFPFKDFPYVEDLGRKTDKFTINGYIVQNKENNFNYFAERNALLKVLREAGPGDLDHPFLGSLLVSLVDDVELTESFREGGIARFRMTFVVTTDVSFYPTYNILDGEQAIDNAVDNGITDMRDSFIIEYQVDDVPSWSLDSMLDAGLAYTQMIRKTITSIRGGVTSTIATALGIIADVESTLSDVINLPTDLAVSIQDGFNSFLGLVGLFEEDFDQIADFDPDEDVTTLLIKSTISALTAIIDFGRQQDNTETGLVSGETKTPSVFGGQVEVIEITTANRARQAANRIAVTNLVRILAILTACRIAVRGKYASFEEAVEVMSSVVNIIDEMLLKLGNEAGNGTQVIFSVYNISIVNDVFYRVLENIRPIFIKAMRALGADLARIIDFIVPTTVTSTLTLAYDRYEDLDRADDLFNRNIQTVNHPGFLPNLQTIEILSE